MGEKKSEEIARFNHHERRLRERLANGETNGTRNHHIIAQAIRFTRDGRQTFIAHIERAMRNGRPEARAWWLIYGDLTESQQDRCDLDDVCEAAGIAPNDLMAIVLSEAARVGMDIADMTNNILYPKVVRQTIRSAMRIGGEHADIAQRDRELVLQHNKYIPTKGSQGTQVTVNNSAQAAAHAAAASQPSVPTFAESMMAPTQALSEVQEQLGGDVVDGQAWED